jgi:hypothetical protein
VFVSLHPRNEAVTFQFVRVWVVTVAMTTAPFDAVAQPFVCRAVKPGDTASAVARRLTGRADSHRQPWFRIVDRERLRVVPKPAYNRILTGWQVCLPVARLAPHVSGVRPTDAIERNAATPLGTSHVTAAPGRTSGAPESHNGTLELAFVFVGPALFGAAIGLGWHRVERLLKNRRSLRREVHDFGNRFVTDFERPLVVDGVVPRPIRARVRWVWHQRRLDILLAPASGHRYPNLDDHRRNVEYDVDRIAYGLRHHPFVRRPLRVEGQWVVVPFQLKPRPQTGDRT